MKTSTKRKLRRAARVTAGVGLAALGAYAHKRAGRLPNTSPLKSLARGAQRAVSKRPKSSIAFSAKNYATKKALGFGGSTALVAGAAVGAPEFTKAAAMKAQGALDRRYERKGKKGHSLQQRAQRKVASKSKAYRSVLAGREVQTQRSRLTAGDVRAFYYGRKMSDKQRRKLAEKNIRKGIIRQQLHSMGAI